MKCRLVPLRILMCLGLVAVFCGLQSIPRAEAQEPFLRADANTDGRISLSDALMSRRFLFLGEPIDCRDALDVDDSGQANITDTVKILNYLFRGGPPPAAPYPETGTDATEDDLACPSYEVVPPEPTDDVVDIGDVSGAPGEAIEVPVFVRSARAVEGFQLVIAYEPEAFTPHTSGSIGEPAQILGLEGTFYGSVDLEKVPSFASVEVADGDDLIIVAFLPDFLSDTVALPPETDMPAFSLRGTIPEDAPAGSSALTPVNVNGGEGYGPAGLKNELTHRGEARLVSVEPQLEGAVLQIVGDQIFFRGDSNADEEIDISDATFTLNYLFVGGVEPVCLDAADANDDGGIDVSDPVATLESLFLGRGPLPPPFSAPGVDPTQDGLDC